MPKRLSILVLTLLVLLTVQARAADNTARERLAAMSPEQKVGQLFTVFFRGAGLGHELKEIIAERHVGGLILYDAQGNVESPRQVAHLVRDAQELALSAGQPGLFIAVDQEGGPVARLRNGFAVPPSNMTIGAAGDTRLAALGALVTAEQLAAVGVNMNFAPSVDVNSNPANPIIGVRSYGESATAVSLFGASAIQATLGAGVIPVAKHFPGHGDTGFDSHLRLPTVPHARERLDALELPPFRTAIALGVPAVMTAHVEVPALEPEPGLPATLSHAILTDLLRGELGFTGLVITDSMTMGAVTERFGLAEAALAAFKAGADVLLFGADKGRDPDAFVPAQERLLQAVQSGEISMQRLDASVLRILEAKQRFGILSPALPDPATAPARTGTAAQREAVGHIAAAGLTLVRDEAGLLPLPADARILALWPGARQPFFSGVAMPAGFAFMALPKDPGPENIALALAAARGFDAVLVLGNRANQRPGQAALLHALARTGLAKRTVLVSVDTPFDGLAAPEIGTWLAPCSHVPASLAALADALFGRTSPQGRLPVSFPDVRPE